MAGKGPFTSGDIRQLIRDIGVNAYSDYQRDGTACIRVGVTIAANTPIQIFHNLTMVPNRIEVLDNGTAFIPAWKRTATPWTAANPPAQGSVYVEFNGALANAIVRIG
jgi:hypothetical protein